MAETLTAISLFTSGGIGDLAIRDAGFELLVSNEIHEDRHAVFAFNFPDTTTISGDIRDHEREIVSATLRRLGGRELDLLYATPPCQGMSKNGRGKLLNAVRAGRKPPLDERNRLIIPTIRIALALRPKILMFENVPEMDQTVILDEKGEAVSILDYISRELGSEYAGKGEVVEFADYGVPQCRQRLITVFSRCEAMHKWLKANGTFLPSRTHSKHGGDGIKKWLTVRDAIGGLPLLDARRHDSATSGVSFHRVPLLDRMKYWWVENTAADSSAFDNQCVACGFRKNATHRARRNAKGINRASIDTPTYCVRCGALLPRPSVEVEVGGKRRLMRGYTSAYKRMSYDRPASALTRNLSYACSDNKLHPEQNRVLSLYEAFRIHTIDRFNYEWLRSDGRRISDKTIREIIGESIPPAGFRVITKHLADLYQGKTSGYDRSAIGPLFSIVAEATD